MTRLVVPIACAVAAFTAAASGQTFRTATEAVRVDVLVTNGNKPVGGLTREDFELLDNGVPQAIDNVSIEEVPFSMLLALDASASMEGRPLRDLREAAVAALDALRPNDRAAILTFAETIHRAAGWQPQGPALVEAVRGIAASGGTALFDAAFTALSVRDPDPGRRALVLLFSDGDDTSSWLPAAAAIDKAGRTDAVVYSVAVGDGRGRSGNRDVPIFGRGGIVAAPGAAPNRRLLHRSGIRLTQSASLIEQSPFLPALSERTGGEAFTAESTDRLRDAFTRIVMDFRSRYLLSYVPKGVDAPGWHRIEVKSRAGRVRARPGYQR